MDLRPMMEKEAEVLTPSARAEYSRMLAEDKLGPGSKSLTDDKQGERGIEAAFFEAGGRFLVGSDSGPSHRLPGFMNLRSVASLWSAFGFTPLEAIQIATLEGARFLGIDHRTGSVAAGKEADLVVINGDPTRKMTDIRNVEIVFSNGARYEPAQLLSYVKGKYSGK